MSRVPVTDPAPRINAPEGVPAPSTPGFRAYWDLVVPQTSAGKDSQTALRAGLAAFPDADGRVAVMHMDLGARVEWPQVPELAAEQAARYGLPLHIASRDGVDLLDDIRTRTKRDGGVRGWPGAGLRYCTSDHKTAPSRRAIEAMCEHIRDARQLGRPVRVLQILGFRAAESRRRAALPAFSFNARQSAATKRIVFDWLPIQGMTTAQVWADIRASGVPYHPAYDSRDGIPGMSRLSCRFCVLASRRDLATARRLSPDVAAQYIAAERAMGHTFQNGRALGSIEPQEGPQGFEVRWTECPMCGVRVLAGDWEPVRFCPAHATSGPWDLHHDEQDLGGPCGSAFLSDWRTS